MKSGDFSLACHDSPSALRVCPLFQFSPHPRADEFAELEIHRVSDVEQKTVGPPVRRTTMLPSKSAARCFEKLAWMLYENSARHLLECFGGVKLSKRIAALSLRRWFPWFVIAVAIFVVVQNMSAFGGVTNAKRPDHEYQRDLERSEARL